MVRLPTDASSFEGVSRQPVASAHVCVCPQWKRSGRCNSPTDGVEQPDCQKKVSLYRGSSHGLRSDRVAADRPCLMNGRKWLRIPTIRPLRSAQQDRSNCLLLYARPAGYRIPFGTRRASVRLVLRGPDRTRGGPPRSGGNASDSPHWFGIAKKPVIRPVLRAVRRRIADDGTATRRRK